jgi:hypothetical protein
MVRTAPLLLSILLMALPPVRTIDAKQDTLFIHAGRFEHTYAVAPGVEPLYIEDGVIHANLRRGKDRYMLLSYSEPYGRAGIESYLVWLHIRVSVVLAMQRAHYESQWATISGGLAGWSGRRFRVVYDQFDVGTVAHSEATFDADAPERGLTIVTQPPKAVSE